MGTTHTRAWRDGRLIARDFPVADVSDHREAGALVWVDLCDRNERDLELIVEELGLSELPVEDALNSHERAKLDRYPGYLFLNVYGGYVRDGELVVSEVSAFITDNALVTIRGDDHFDTQELEGRWSLKMTRLGVPYLLHGLLDQVVDEHLSTLQTLDDEVDELADKLFEDGFSDRDLQIQAFELRRSLVLLRRVVLPMREILNSLLRRDSEFVPTELAPYFEDVYDHAIRANEWTESLRDLVGNVMDTRIALQGNRMNEVMKKVTSWAAIIAVPTAVTGYYGMNVPYPGTDQWWGYLTSIAVVAVTSIGLWVVFKKKEWL